MDYGYFFFAVGVRMGIDMIRRAVGGPTAMGDASKLPLRVFSLKAF